MEPDAKPRLMRMNPSSFSVGVLGSNESGPAIRSPLLACELFAIHGVKRRSEDFTDQLTIIY